MSIQEPIQDHILNLSESFISTGPEFEELGEQISCNIECLQEYISALERYQAKLGTNQDTREMRARMKEDIADGNRTIMKTVNLFQEFDALNLKKKVDQDARNKISRRARLSFDLAKDRYTRALREVHRKEKAYVDITRSQMESNSEEIEETKISDLEIGKEQEVKMYVKDLDFYKPVLPKNKKIPIKKIYYQEYRENAGQIRSWQEKARDLEDELEKMAREDEKSKAAGNMHHKQAYESFKTKKRLYAILGGVLLATVIAVFLLLNANKLGNINE